MTGRRQRPLLLTQGDPAGIGPELTLKAWLGRSETPLPGAPPASAPNGKDAPKGNAPAAKGADKGKAPAKDARPLTLTPDASLSRK